jgi:hypothetical protein
MPLWPALFCVNLWLVALGVPLLLAGATRSPSLFALLAAPLGPLCFVVGLRHRRSRYGQAALLIGVPLLTMLPGADGALADPRLQPRPAVLLQVAMLLGYLASLCRHLAQRGDLGDGKTLERSVASATAASAEKPSPPWQVTPLSQRSDSLRLSRRVLVHRLLLAYTIALPSLFIYAIDLHPANQAALRASFGTLRRVSAMQSTLTAGVAVLSSVLFYFCIMAPLASYLDHHRALRTELQTARRQARRGKPRVALYVFMVLALSSMVLLIVWSLRQ